MMSDLELANNKLLKEWTIKYFNYIKLQLAVSKKYVEYINDISFIYDKDMLKSLCEEEGINMKYTSNYGNGQTFNPYIKDNRIEYSYKVKTKIK